MFRCFAFHTEGIVPLFQAPLGRGYDDYLVEEKEAVSELKEMLMVVSEIVLAGDKGRSVSYPYLNPEGIPHSIC